MLRSAKRYLRRVSSIRLTAAVVIASVGFVAAQATWVSSAQADVSGPVLNHVSISFNDGSPYPLSDSTANPYFDAQLYYELYDPDGICGNTYVKTTDQKTGISSETEYNWGTSGYEWVDAGHYFRMKVGNPYEVSVTAQDCAGNATTANSYYTSKMIDQTGPGITKAGTWGTRYCKCWTLGSTAESTDNGSTISITTAGPANIIPISDRGPNRASASVTVDGRTASKRIYLKGSVINRYPLITPKGYTSWWIESGTHTVTVRNAYNPNLDGVGNTFFTLTHSSRCGAPARS